MVSSYLRLLLLLPLALALSTPLERRWTNVQTKHAWEDVPNGWVVHEVDAPKDHMLKMKIGLKQDRFDELVEELLEVSDPSHERYVQHLFTIEESAHASHFLFLKIWRSFISRRRP